MYYFFSTTFHGWHLTLSRYVLLHFNNWPALVFNRGQVDVDVNVMSIVRLVVIIFISRWDSGFRTLKYLQSTYILSGLRCQNLGIWGNVRGTTGRCLFALWESRSDYFRSISFISTKYWVSKSVTTWNVKELSNLLLATLPQNGFNLLYPMQNVIFQQCNWHVHILEIELKNYNNN